MASSDGTSLLKGRWTIWVIALVFSLLAGFGVLTIMGSAAEQRPYWVMMQDVPARTPIDMSMLEMITTSGDGYPPTALSEAQITEQQLFTVTALAKGEVITSSVVGTLLPINADVEIPSNYVTVSLSVSPENAVAGRISAGDLVDIAAVTEDLDGPVAKVVLANIRVLDVSVTPGNIASAAVADGSAVAPTGPDSVVARDGIPQIYTFSVSPEQFTKLALLRDKNVYLALSSADLLDPNNIPSVTERELFNPEAPRPEVPGGEEVIIEEDVVEEN